MTPKYPNIEVKLSDNDGNCFAVMGAVKKALRKNNVPQEEINLYLEQAMSGDYNQLLRTTMEWVEVI